MNRVIFVGNLASDVETRTTNSGKTCALFRLAVQRIRSNKDGQREADFFPVVAWGKTAELCVRFLSRGRKVAIDGRLETRSYNAQDGSKRHVTEIIDCRSDHSGRATKWQVVNTWICRIARDASITSARGFAE